MSSSVSLNYTLPQIENIIFNGFNYTIPDEVCKILSSLAVQVGSPDYIKTPVFKKRDFTINIERNNTTGKDLLGKKRRGNKHMEVINEVEWNSGKTFKPTIIETKSKIQFEFDTIRSLINKMTDKNYNEKCDQIITTIEKIVIEHDNDNVDLSIIADNIFEIASSNRYYSKIYAELYTCLSLKFDFINIKYKEQLTKFIDLFNNIEYVDPNENYDKFCEVNKNNEKRKSLAAFYINLMNCGIVPKSEIINITRNLLSKMYECITIENKKNEVEELTETIAILYNKDLYNNEQYEKIDGMTINEIVNKIAHSKVKDFKSLTNKSLFKFMDLIEM